MITGNFKRRGAVVGHLDVVSLFAQSLGKQPNHMGVVFNDQDLHEFTPNQLVLGMLQPREPQVTGLLQDFCRSDTGLPMFFASASDREQRETVCTLPNGGTSGRHGLACPAGQSIKGPELRLTSFCRTCPNRAPAHPNRIAIKGATTRCVKPASSVLAMANARTSVHPLRLNSAHVATEEGSGGRSKSSKRNPAVTASSIQIDALKTAAETPDRNVPSAIAARNPAAPQERKTSSINPSVIAARFPILFSIAMFRTSR